MWNVGLVSNSIGLFFFGILSVLLLVNWRRQLIGNVLLLASLISTGWFAGLVFIEPDDAGYSLVHGYLEIFRSAAWLLFLIVVINQRLPDGAGKRSRMLLPALAVTGIAGMLLISTHQGLTDRDLLPETTTAAKLAYLGYLVLAVTGLLLIEKLYRSTAPYSRWSIKYLCLGIGGLFAYDFFLYSDSLLFNRLNVDLLEVRGVINALCVPLIAVSVARNPTWNIELFVSRHVIYGSTTTLAAGLYLLVMAVAGYYIKNFGGDWGPALQIVFFFGSLIVLLVLIFSADLRARIKIFLAKHFYRNKYDYREEWLGFTNLLSRNKDDREFYRNIIKAISGIIKSPGGALWLFDERDSYRLEAQLNFHERAESSLPATHHLVKFIKSSRYVIDLQQYRKGAPEYESVSLPEWIAVNPRLRLIVPLLNGDDLIGLAIFLDPRIKMTFNWEDMDLLKTVGMQSASYIALFRTTEALSEARQFEAYNRLSAYVVHDLKNLVAQLSLISTNAKKYRHNPEFIEDAFATIESAVVKMKRLLGSLKRGATVGDTASHHPVRIVDVVQEVIKLRQTMKPVPVFEADSDDADTSLHVDSERLVTVLEHLVQNAQEATPDDGQVRIKLARHDGSIEIRIHDTGCGMDEEFIQKRLFKPFDTTKGNAGMGIGVYESREAIEEMGGKVHVASRPGKGTVFSIVLPIAEAAGPRYARVS